MVLSKWIYTRLPCGVLPCYHLLSQDEAELEKQISELYFNSSKFADHRMQIRLKLKETPQSNQRDNPANYWATLELLDEYLPQLLAIRHYHSTRLSNSQTAPYLLTIFPPLFYGFGEFNLSHDRLVGRDQRAQYCIAVELVFLLFTMAQLHVMHAESQIEQGSQFPGLSSLSAMQHAEMSWQSAESFFRWTASYSREAAADVGGSDSLSGTVLTFFNAMMVYATTLSRMCAIHRISTHIIVLTLSEKSPERLFRLSSTCARRAHTLVCESTSLLTNTAQSRFGHLLGWCLKAYEVRWKAIYHHCELQLYHLDANPEVALYISDGLLRLRLPALPPSSPQQDAWFIQAAHELRLLHHFHLNKTIDEKKALLNACRERFGNTWSYQPPEKHLLEELLALRKVASVFYGDQALELDGIEDEESNYTSQFLMEVIAANVDEAIMKAGADFPSMALAPTDIIKKGEGLASKHGSISTQNAPGVNKIPIAPGDEYRPETLVDSPLKKPKEAELLTKAATLTPGELKKRPSSASQPSTGWVTMNYAGKVLHFEKSVESSGVHRHDSRSNATGEAGHKTSSTCPDARSSKPRPASSPCYLSSKLTAKAKSYNSSTVGNQLANTNMWAPTRAPCALCERRFIRSSLPGVVVMKRIYDVRRKWGMVIQNSKKFSVPSSMYGTANVCLMCQEILASEENKELHRLAEGKGLDGQLQELDHEVSPIDPNVGSMSNSTDKDTEVTQIIHDSIMYHWHQQPSNRLEDHKLQDIAVNKRARQSSTVFNMKARNALIPDSNRSAHTKEEFQPWWEIDLANYVEVHSIRVYLRDEVSHLYASARGLAANPNRQTPGVYPLHISISMKTGVGRDCDDIVTSCVSSLCVKDKIGPPIEWIAPHTSRGRFVRIQCEKRAILHIERVHVYVVKPPPRLSVVNDPVARRQTMRQKLQRAAFCASVIATTASPVPGIQQPIATPPMPKMSMRNKRRTDCQIALTNADDDSNLASALFFDPERAEKRRISRLYARFKSLLDSRVKYIVPENEANGDTTTKEEGDANQTQENQSNG